MTFPAKRSQYFLQLAFSVSIDVQPDDLSPEPIPVRAFWPSLHAAEATL
jgi:hypothetical protein